MKRNRVVYRRGYICEIPRFGMIRANICRKKCRHICGDI